MSPEQPQHFDLTLDHLLTAAGIEDNAAVLLVRHTYKPDGLRGPADMTLNKVLTYTREQSRKGKVPANPPSLWLTFIADGGRRSRFVTAYDNLDVVDAPDHIPWKRAQAHRWFDLRQSDLLSSLRDRLVIEWTSDTINWAKSGRSAEAMRVVEIADPEAVPFPGYDRFVIDYSTLQAVIDDSRYASWRTALAAVQGIYLIADKKTGRLLRREGRRQREVPRPLDGLCARRTRRQRLAQGTSCCRRQPSPGLPLLDPAGLRSDYADGRGGCRRVALQRGSSDSRPRIQQELTVHCMRPAGRARSRHRSAAVDYGSLRS